MHERQSDQLLRRIRLALVNDIIRRRVPESCWQHSGIQVSQSLLDVNASDGGEIHGRQSAPLAPPRKPTSYIFI